MASSTWGWKYRDGSRICIGDKVSVSKKIADTYAGGDRKGIVVDLRRFITVELAVMSNNEYPRIDLDLRSITKGWE
jgi:hypothetical protein